MCEVNLTAVRACSVLPNTSKSLELSKQIAGGTVESDDFDDNGRNEP